MAQSLSNLPIGSKIKFGKHSVNGETAQDIIWLMVAKNHDGYPVNSVTLLTEKVIDLRAYDAAEPNNSITERASGGNNDYVLSNIARWLNSASTSWYTAAHTTDQAPNDSNLSGGAPYDTRPGFLSNFNTLERNAILSSTLNVLKYYKTTESFTAKIFLPSPAEIGAMLAGEPLDGSQWAYFNSDNHSTTLTEQCFNNTLCTIKPASTTADCGYWLRSAKSDTRNYSYYAFNTSNVGQVVSKYSGNGVRPALNLPSTLLVSDTTGSDGCYSVVWNSAPPTPTTLTVPTIYGGKATTISWSSATDPDGNAVTYQLERSIDGGAFTTIYTGANLSYSNIVPFGTKNVQFRVKAIDSLGASSVYITTSTSVINNNAPTISGSDGSLGTKNVAFSHTYTVGDADNDTVTVVERLNGVIVRSYVATLGATNTFSVTGNTWLTLANGTHTITITANDGIDSSTRTFTFVKSVSSFTIENTTPMVASVRPTRIKVEVNKTIPAEATMKIEVCNNGYDSSPTWENATSAMNSGLIHLFSNTTKTATNWGVKIRVTVNRNGGSGACYVSSIGGNWE